jgi:hypothetical protein
VVAALNLAVHRSMVSIDDLIERYGPTVKRTADVISGENWAPPAVPSRAGHVAFWHRPPPVTRSPTDEFGASAGLCGKPEPRRGRSMSEHDGRTGSNRRNGGDPRNGSRPRTSLHWRACALVSSLRDASAARFPELGRDRRRLIALS